MIDGDKTKYIKLVVFTDLISRKKQRAMGGFVYI